MLTKQLIFEDKLAQEGRGKTVFALVFLNDEHDVKWL